MATITGTTGADAMTGTTGNDSYTVNHGSDTVTEGMSEGWDTIFSSVTYTLDANVEALTLTGHAAIDGTGNDANNRLNGADNNGANVLTGGLGHDSYLIGDGDTVVEGVDGGSDQVKYYGTSGSYTLGDNVETLILANQSGTSTGTGNALDNSVMGNNSNNILDGGLGADAMSGGTGNDTYKVDNVGDTVTENADAGLDTVESAVSFTLGANIEYLSMQGSADINGTGNDLDNSMESAWASGANVMTGGLGNDRYHIGDNDTVVELADEGASDIIFYYGAAATYTLDANVEGLSLQHTIHGNANGNELNNSLWGNSYNNILDGKAGRDMMMGRAGDDTYVVDHIYDSVLENADEGTDSVLSSVSRTMSANVENLTLTGSADLDGTGNASANSLNGNDGNNVLNGDAGDDMLNGGLGADTLNGGAGTDTVSYANATSGVAVLLNLGGAVGAHLGEANGDTFVGIENISGSAHSDYLVGDGVGNVINAGVGNDALIGNAGNDTLNGGGGADHLNGGSGSDIIRYTATSDSTSASRDTIANFDATDDAEDIFLDGLLSGIFSFLGSSATAFTNTGNTEARFDDGTDLLQIDTNGDATVDMEMTLVGVNLADLGLADFTVT